MPATSCKSKKISRKRIEKRLLDSRFRISIPESFRLFVPHEKSELSAEKTIQTTWLALLAMASKILYPGNSLLRQFQFSQPSQGNSRHYGNFQRAVFGFSYFKSLLRFWEKGKFDGTSMEFGLSLMIELREISKTCHLENIGSKAKYATTFNACEHVS